MLHPPRTRSPIALPVALLVAGLVGCESDYEVTNDDGTGGAGRGTPDIEVVPSALDFGSVEAGQTHTLTTAIRNAGNATLQIHAFVLDGPDSFVIADDGLDRLLAPEEEVELSVTYAPITSEAATGTLYIESNDPEDERFPVALQATGLAPRIEITPNSWDMGDWEIGCETEVELRVRNVGSADLVVDDVSFEPTSPDMSLTPHALAGTVMVPGDQRSLFVRFAPTDTLDDAGYLYVDSNDPANPRAMATQTGRGHLGARLIDSYVQEGNNWTDILWVVDNSCSMDLEQASMAANFSAFLGIVQAADVDYHIAVVTTDSYTFRVGNGVRVIDPLTSDPETAFAAMVQVGTSGSGSEMGLKFGSEALTPPITDPGHTNENFLRDEAGLRVVFVSDEEDQSPNTVTSYVSYLQSLKINPEHVVLSAISGQNTGCSSAAGSADPAPRYESAVSSTAGISSSICDSDWIATLTDLAWASLSFQDTFQLTAQPVVESIEVYVNGVPIYVGWQYDGSLNAVIFDPDYIPDNGDQVDVAYNVLGVCGG